MYKQRNKLTDRHIEMSRERNVEIDRHTETERDRGDSDRGM